MASWRGRCTHKRDRGDRGEAHEAEAMTPGACIIRVSSAQRRSCRAACSPVGCIPCMKKSSSGSRCTRRNIRKTDADAGARRARGRAQRCRAFTPSPSDVPRGGESLETASTIVEGSVQELTDGGDGEGATGGADAPLPPTEHAQAQEEESQDDSHPGKALFHVVFGWELKRSGHAWPFPRAGAVLFL